MALIKLYAVKADAETGEWITQPEWIGMIEDASLARQRDTKADHWDTFERDGKTCGLRVFWQ